MLSESAMMISLRGIIFQLRISCCSSEVELRRQIRRLTICDGVDFAISAKMLVT
jgi:hypothetical protein